MIAFLGTLAGGLATAILFNVPRRVLWLTPLAGLGGYFTLHALDGRLSRPAALFLAAFAVAMVAELLARWNAVPALVFTVNGILPLVPGSVAYRGMAANVRGDYASSAEMLSLALFSAGAIATGLLLASSLWRLRPRHPVLRSLGPG